MHSTVTSACECKHAADGAAGSGVSVCHSVCVADSRCLRALVVAALSRF